MPPSTKPLRSDSPGHRLSGRDLHAGILLLGVPRYTTCEGIGLEKGRRWNCHEVVWQQKTWPVLYGALAWGWP